MRGGGLERKLTAAPTGRSTCRGPHPDSRPEAGRARGSGPPRVSRMFCPLASHSLRVADQRPACRELGGGGGRGSPRRPHRSCLPRSSLCLLPQSESEEKVVTYDHIGPNVCMGDHKVKCPRCGRGPRGRRRRAAGRAGLLLLQGRPPRRRSRVVCLFHCKKYQEAGR